MSRGFRPKRLQQNQRWKSFRRRPFPRHREENTRFTLVECITAATAVVGAAVLCLTALVTAYQAWLSRKALAEATDARRPWVQVEAKHLGPFTINDAGASLMILVSAKNVGTTPALNLQRSVYLISSSEPARDPCAVLPTGEDGPTVFPGEMLDLLPTQPSVPAPIMKQLRASGETTAFTALVCVSYQIREDGPVRRTGSTFFVERHLKNRDTIWWTLDPQTVSSDLVHIHRFSGYDTAN